MPVYPPIPSLDVWFDFVNMDRHGDTVDLKNETVYLEANVWERWGTYYENVLL